MNKKQTIRTLGSIESKQTKQTKQPTQTKQTEKKINKELDLESGDNIETNSDYDLEEIDLVEQPIEEPIKEPIKKKKEL